MASILPIVLHPDERLRRVTSKIELVRIASDELQLLCDTMVATMYADDGIGLAAPQVGFDGRLIVIGKNALNGQKSDLIIFNPELSSYSLNTTFDEEGCLSVPGILGEVERHVSVTLSGVNRNGTSISLTLTDFAARVAQHECDHLNGVLFIDRARAIHPSQQRGKL